VRGPCTLPTPEAEARPRQRANLGRDCSAPNPAAPHQLSVDWQPEWHVLSGSLRQEYSGQSNGTASLTSTPLLVHSAAHTPRDSASGAFACLDWIGCSQWNGRAAACSRLQHVPYAAGSIVRRWHSAAAQCTWLQPVRCCANLGLAQGDVPADAVPVQMGAGHRLGPGADVGGA
jgi:hypothetical protein